MRYSVLEFKLENVDTIHLLQGEYNILPVNSLIGISDGDDIKITSTWKSDGCHPDLNRIYSQKAIGEDGVRLYQSSGQFYIMMLIPETHTYYNSGLILLNCMLNDYKGAQYHQVYNILRKMFEKIQKTV